MRISARCDYACKALLELALHWPSKEPLPLHEISKKQNIPIRYLVHILIQLKRLGLVNSMRGKEGGYSLAIAPGKITLNTVIDRMGGPLLPVADSVVKNGSVFSTIWKEIEKAIAKALNKITLEDITNKAKGLEKAVNYQI